MYIKFLNICEKDFKKCGFRIFLFKPLTFFFFRESFFELACLNVIRNCVPKRESDKNKGLFYI